jgi:hypothetical protein
MNAGVMENAKSTSLSGIRDGRENLRGDERDLRGDNRDHHHGLGARRRGAAR